MKARMIRQGVRKAMAACQDCGMSMNPGDRYYTVNRPTVQLVNGVKFELSDHIVVGSCCVPKYFKQPKKWFNNARRGV